MRHVLTALAALALSVLTFIVPAHAAGHNQIVSTYGTTNAVSTPWSTTDCNGEATILRCTLTGSDGDDGPDGDMGDNGKH